MKLKMHPSIQLTSGNYFNFTDPDSTPLLITDMAAGLSRICRYTGHLRDMDVDNYSVAQHCVLASEHGPALGDPYEYLMHDGAESVIGDVSSPFKQLLPDYHGYEKLVETSLSKQYNTPYPMSAYCKEIDLRMLCTEKRDLMPEDKDGDFWSMCNGIEPLPFTIVPWSRKEAYHRFLHRYYFLTTGKFPQPNWEFGEPHDNAPKAYIEDFYTHWFDEENCDAAGLRMVVVGTRLPRAVWVAKDTALTVGELAGLDRTQTQARPNEVA